MTKIRAKKKKEAASHKRSRGCFRNQSLAANCGWSPVVGSGRQVRQVVIRC